MSISKISPIRWIFDKILSNDFILLLSTEILSEYYEKPSEKTTEEIANNLIGFLSTVQA